jgi:hypothetical protein
MPILIPTASLGTATTIITIITIKILEQNLMMERNLQ